VLWLTKTVNASFPDESVSWPYGATQPAGIAPPPYPAVTYAALDNSAAVSALIPVAMIAPVKIEINEIHQHFRFQSLEMGGINFPHPCALLTNYFLYKNKPKRLIG
jgi:hypothetical protein